MSKSKLIVTTVAAVMLATTTSASALSYQDILGNWCGISTNPHLSNINFTQNSLSVTFIPAGNSVSYNISSYEFSPSFVKINYWYNGELTFVYYENFSSDDQRMSQHVTKEAGAYTFVRC